MSSQDTPSYSGERAYRVNTPKQIIENVEDRYRKALQLIDPNDKVLDYGCGSGIGTEIIAKNCHSVVGYDIDSEQIDENKQKNEIKDIRYTSDKNELNNEYDVVTCFEVIEHIPKNSHKEFVENVISRIGSKGTAVFSTPIAYGFAGDSNPSNPDHTYEYTFCELLDLFSDYGVLNFFDSGESFCFYIENQSARDEFTYYKMFKYYMSLSVNRFASGEMVKGIKYLINSVYANPICKKWGPK